MSGHVDGTIESPSLDPQVKKVPEKSPWRTPVAEEMKALDEMICQQLSSEVPLIRHITQYIVKSGGKRIRPLFLLLVAAACGYEGDEHIELAAVIEFIHTATLLHDDVVDNSALRRGVQTAHQVYGGNASILVGDFLYSRAFQLMSQRSNVPAMQYLATVTNEMSEGEVLQLMALDDAPLSQTHYEQIINSKTAGLFSAAAYTGALLAEQQHGQLLPGAKDFAKCGRQFGMAYQIIDDVLDYCGQEEALGKMLGDDLAEGKVTLPIIYTLKNSPVDVADTITTIISEKRRTNLDIIIEAMHDCQALEYCRGYARQYVGQAIRIVNQLPASIYRDALQSMLSFSLLREH